jgi:uncharacterized coiled-coil protein SlyX
MSFEMKLSPDEYARIYQMLKDLSQQFDQMMTGMNDMAARMNNLSVRLEKVENQVIVLPQHSGSLFSKMCSPPLDRG